MPRTTLLSGPIPPTLLQLPNIEVVVIRGSAQSIALPATVSPTLKTLYVSTYGGSLGLTIALPVDSQE